MASVLLGACSTVGGSRHPGHAASDARVLVGRPYTVRGVTYTPAAVASYDEVGYASWYGEEQSGNPTANGERFVPKAVSAAHRTLPLPTYVEVTALATGKTILVRINDRGPFARGRIIDLSRGAAEQLGIRRAGVAAVRVRMVHPGEREKAALREGEKATERPVVPPAELAMLRARLASGAEQEVVAQGNGVPPAAKGFRDTGIMAKERP